MKQTSLGKLYQTISNFIDPDKFAHEINEQVCEVEGLFMEHKFRQALITFGLEDVLMDKLTENMDKLLWLKDGDGKYIAMNNKLYTHLEDSPHAHDNNPLLLMCDATDEFVDKSNGLEVEHEHGKLLKYTISRDDRIVAIFSMSEDVHLEHGPDYTVTKVRNIFPI